MNRKLTVALIAASFATAGIIGTASAKTTVRIGTLAPKHSPWGKVFSKWAEEVDKKTNSEVEVQWLWNGTAGPESSMVGKIKAGQISGAAITAVGLSAIHKPIVALQMPGAFESWAALDKARDALKPDFDKAMTEQGFYVAGWGDVGVARIMSRGYAVKVPDDLKGKTPGHISTDIIGPKVYEVIGGITPKPADVVEFLPLLNANAIDALNTPALAAEQLQWSSRLDHLNTGITGYGVGATVMSEAEMAKLSPEHRQIMQDVGSKAAQALTKIIRKEDDKAFERLRSKMTTHEQTAAEREVWQAVFKKACNRVKSALSADVLTKIGYC
ncbi:MAG: TRAP transporter substrate-binding protein DctP [Deltaproteobacteria bacterium]|nr:TRAP transporter substrate-binding protein DctP [Deltaproteobacteria bacterium]